MQIFTDNAGRKWEIVIDVKQMKAVRDVLGVQLYSLFDNDLKGYTALVSDLVVFVDVLYLLCRQQATAQGVSDEAFGTAMRRNVLVEARNAFTKELVDFFPDGQREMLATLIETIQVVANSLTVQAAAVTLAISTRMSSLPTPTSSPAASASTPDP